MKKRINKSVAGLTAVTAAMLAAAAYAAPQESVTFTAVNSNGGFNNAVNDVRTKSSRCETVPTLTAWLAASFRAWACVSRTPSESASPSTTYTIPR